MSNLTISQGLRLVKKLKGQLAEVTGRAQGAVSFDVKSKPVFPFADQVRQRDEARERLVTLEAAVARANATTEVTFGGRAMTLAEAIRRLQELKGDIGFFQGLTIREGTVRQGSEYEWDTALQRQVSRPVEVTYETSLKEVDRVAKVQALRDEFDGLNDAVETANHRTPIAWQDTKVPAQTGSGCA
ncbi:hypothetical protein A3E39_04205 [Candidatus Uhrbacteria bacterium RIFCSPHIGHO2_12_FULL_60_25]|uniref:Uncharacterized protein n=1 Tax=Candidatus Uhrbacteria bacterium RIFCSPHIGHO2_12_FULL_60_25 TaxID=1802399 RepID=A0A1F7UN70_9BACT|nr:MAG: hypothetical protein A3D73_01230 [Candidatus Uhrbacteria bacterium RIFCSPHIGHO2_02_FULL_60_44]OGL79137.1 MAG: hypothetical protein A3E39_04205 [Candidatus Uhrbacteria bacterium RIFCSPHIGHO2_12_FULL_60_25]